MPELANPRHEQFARALADGMKQKDAYVQAGFNDSPSSASQLANEPHVRERINELHEERILAHRAADNEDGDFEAPTRAWVIKQLQINLHKSQSAGQIAPANKALELIMDLMGLTAPAPKQRDKEESDADKKRQAEAVPDNAKIGNVLDRLTQLTGDDE
jgi:hypothetical protein